MLFIVKVKKRAPYESDRPFADAVVGWISASDVHEARYKATSVGESNLAAELYRREFVSPGKFLLTTTTEHEYWLFAD